MHRRRTRFTVAGTALMLSATASLRADFTSGNLILMQLGGNTANAQAVTLLEFSLASGTPVMVKSSTLPTTGPGALTLSGQGTHDGHLNFSSDGRYILLAGYRADLNSTNPIATSATVDPRVIGRVDASFVADTSTALTDAYNTTEIEAVASVDGNSFWTGGDAGSQLTTSAGLRYVANLGATTTTNVSQTQTTTASLQPDSLRNIKIINGQMYDLTASAGSFGNRGLYATSVPLPTSGVTSVSPVMVNVEGTSGAKGQELGADGTGKLVPKTDVVFADLSSTIPGYDTAYSTGGKADYEKWSLVANGSAYIWQQVNTFTLTGSPDINALALTMSGTTVNLFAATGTGIYKYADSAGYIPSQTAAGAGSRTVTIPAPIISLASSNYAFRGIAAVPTTFATSRQLPGINSSTGGTTQFPAAASAMSRILYVTPSLNLSGGSLDLTNNDLDVTGLSLAMVTDLVAAGYNGPAGPWTGTGITSSTAAADVTHLHALGVIQNNQSGTPIYTVANPFDGYVPGAADILIKYTYLGDANLDGVVDGSDYSRIDAAYLANSANSGSATGWFNGDFNYDSSQNGSDYTLIDNAFNNQGAAISNGVIFATATSLISPVPEPGAIGGHMWDVLWRHAAPQDT